MSMRLTINRLLMSAALSLLIACTDDTPRLALLPEEAVILAFGDSLTHGTGAQPAQSYPAQLAILSGRKVVNAGVPGELSGAGLARLSSTLERTDPALLLLCHGGNDMLQKKDLRKAARNLKEMIAMARRHKVQVVLIGVPKPGLFLSTADFYADVAAEMAVPAELDALTDIISDASLKSDAIHPNGKGYRRLAQAIFDLLKKSGASVQ